MNKKILVIEDDIHLQPIYQDKLGELGYTLFWEETGESALETAKKEHPDLILLDILLAGTLNGYDVLKKLKKDPTLSNIPVLILTNIGTEGQSAKELGAVDYLIKTSVSLKDIVNKIEQHCPNE